MKNLVILLGLCFWSCSKLTPSGFWLDYKSDQQVIQSNNQGPWGGTLMVHYKAEPDSSFNFVNLERIAKKNAWQFIDSTTLDPIANENTGVQLPLLNFEPNAKAATYVSKTLPRWINTEAKLYRFQTNMLMFDPGTDDATRENGYILLSTDKKEMTIYTIWGQ